MSPLCEQANRERRPTAQALRAPGINKGELLGPQEMEMARIGRDSDAVAAPPASDDLR